MKGAMSSPHQVMSRSIYETLYPSTTYRFNSGGDPAVIPRLTYSQLKAFHERHYHPSNAFFYTYGNIPLKEILDYIQESVLKNFERIDPETDVPIQRRWKKPKEKTFYYPFAKEEDPSRKCQVCVAWLTADIKDSFEVLILTLLEQVLLGNAASPLRKTLIESGLGSALADGSGYVSDNRDTLFSCGLKDVTESSAGEIERIIFDTLRYLAEDGIDKDRIESAIHQLEFHRKEITNHPYPYGIRQLLSFAGSWFHGGDPIAYLKFESDIEKIRKELKKSRFFEERIERYFLNNCHRARITLVPDQDMEDRENRRIAAELEDIWKTLEPSDLEKINEAANALRVLQESEEDLSCLPTLERNDIPSSVQSVEETTSYNDIPAICYRQPTSGIFYFSAAIGVGALDDKLLPLVPLFCQSFCSMGTEFSDYIEMTKRIDAATGGVALFAHARTRFGREGQCVPFVSLNGKCLYRNEAAMFDILQELLFHFDFSDLTRLKHLILEYRSGMESMVVRSGHRFAMSIASRNFSFTSALSEIWHGIYQLRFIKELADDLTEEKLATLSEDLAGIGRSLMRRDNIKMAIIGEDRSLREANAPVTEIISRLRDGVPDGSILPRIPVKGDRVREGWATASAVSFVARAFQTVRMGHQDSPALYVISKLLRSLYLHREIREKGGAYGGLAIYNPEDGIFSFASYRDPHILNTLRVYDGAARFVRSGDYTDEDIDEAILQACSDIDKPDPPGAAAIKAFYRKMISLSDEDRNRFKRGILTLTRRQVQTAAQKYFDPTHEDYSVAVISSDEKLKAANRSMTDYPLTLHRI
jgi:Zn-dependent M16 (insulinase) family peptidase